MMEIAGSGPDLSQIVMNQEIACTVTQKCLDSLVLFIRIGGIGKLETDQEDLPSPGISPDSLQYLMIPPEPDYHRL